MTFGTLLRSTRRTAGYSLSQVSANLGVNKAYLSMVERDMKPPLTDGALTHMAGAFGVDPAPLLASAAIARASLNRLPPERRQFIRSIILQVEAMTDEEYAAFTSLLS